MRIRRTTVLGLAAGGTLALAGLAAAHGTPGWGRPSVVPPPPHHHHNPPGWGWGWGWGDQGNDHGHQDGGYGGQGWGYGDQGGGYGNQGGWNPTSAWPQFGDGNDDNGQ